MWVPKSLCSYVTQKVAQVAVILTNTAYRNIWIHHPLLDTSTDVYTQDQW